MLYEKRCSYKLHKFTGKHLCESLFFNKFAGLRDATLVTKKLSHMYFPVNFAKFLRTPDLLNTSDWLLLILSVAYFLYFSLSKIVTTKKGASSEKSQLVENRLYWKKILNASFIEYRVTIFTRFSYIRLESENFFSWLSVKVLYGRAFQFSLS